MYRIRQYNISPRNNSFEKAVSVNIRISKAKLEQFRIKLAKKHNCSKSDILFTTEELRPSFLRNRINKLTLNKRKYYGKRHIRIKK